MDNPVLSKTVDSPRWLQELKAQAIDVNRIYADKLGVTASTAITCVKPSGTVSQLTDTASGIHARHSAYYIRTVRGDNKDPLTQFMKDSGIPAEPCVMKPKNYALNWCEHKPSVTITVKDAEWMAGYAQAPYQDIDEEQYKELKQQMPESIDWTALSLYEKEDTTSGSQTLACTAGACELVDI